MPEFTVEHRTDHIAGLFLAMGSPCEILIDADDLALAKPLIAIAHQEALRIEHKFSRYRDDNIVHRIHRSGGQPLEVDEETAKLLDYAAQCYALTEGKFDITSGVLRAVWKFDGSNRIPSRAQVNAILPRVGWEKVRWDQPRLTLPKGMEIDFGGIGKEYAVDRSALLLRAQTAVSFVVNYGGDLYVSAARARGECWRIGVDDPTATGTRAVGQIQIAQGGVATSGDARRYLLADGVRYGHILNPKTGWPVTGAPRSVTVVAPTCIEAGMLATFAMLEGANAENFLREQGVKFWMVP